ncbi:MAG: flagellar filament capping protein FliD [Alkalispirochaeta sp.]
MSDISIPGISNSSGMNTSKMVDDLMEVERIPVRRMESQVETYELQKDVWQSVGRGVARLRDTARRMYGFESPFRERNAISSNESILRATADRRAEEALEEVTVVRVAGRDRFASSPLPRDFDVPSGRYEFSLGDETRSMRFSGGSLRDFAGEINRRLETIVRATVVPDTQDTQVIILEGQKEGAAAQLTFGEDATGLMEQIGVMSRPRPEDSVALLQEQPLLLEPGQEDRITLDQPFAIDPGMILRFEARSRDLPREEWTPPDAPPGPELPEPGSTTLEGITITDELPGFSIPQPEEPEPPPFVEDNRAMAIIGAGREQQLPPLPESSEFRAVEIPASELVSSTEGFVFRNRNTHRELEVRNIEILDPSRRGGSTPANALDTAQDAIVRYSGIEVQRESNEIDDLIPGVTLNLLRASTEPVEIDIQPDRENAKDAIIEFIGYYNQLVRDINIYTRDEPELIEQIEYFSEDERGQMEERLGILQGESSLNQLRSRMQTIMMDPYDTGLDSSYRLLAEIGISTNASGVGGGFDASRLRGYLEINEAVLDDALASDFESVGRLFGRDTDGDLVTDTGLAVALERYITPYAQTGGIIAGRTDGLDTRIDQTEERISRTNRRLEDYEQELRSDFGRMEGMMDQMEESSRALDRLGGPETNQQ